MLMQLIIVHVSSLQIISDINQKNIGTRQEPPWNWLNKANFGEQIAIIVFKDTDWTEVKCNTR